MRGESGHEMTLSDYWRVLTRRLWLVIVALIATITPAIVLSLVQAPVYEAQARMLLQSATSDSLFTNTAQSGSSTVANEIQVVEGEVVYQRLKHDLGLTEDPPRAIGSAVGDTDVVIISVRSGDPVTAAAIANAYVNAYINTKRSQAVAGLVAASEELQSKITELQDQIKEIDKRIGASATDDDTNDEAQRRVLVDQQALFKQRIDQLQVDAALTGGGAQLVRPAVVPSDAVEPTPVRSAGLALAVGLLLGVGAALLVDFLDNSVRRPADLTRLGGGLPVLAVVPIGPSLDGRPIALSRPSDVGVESYRSLRTNVQFLGLEKSMTVFEVTSALPGEGKTTTAANLAVVLAQTGASVALVDADLRKPRLHEVFSARKREGLSDVLIGTELQSVEQTVDANLVLITAGGNQTSPSEMLGGTRMQAVIDALRLRFDYVIVDSAPIGLVNDAVALSRHVDAVIVVVQLGKTTDVQVTDSMRTLSQVSAPLIGFVANRARSRDLTAGGYGYGYG